MNPHIFFLGAVEASRLVARAAHSADHAAPVARRGGPSSTAKPSATRFWRRFGER